MNTSRQQFPLPTETEEKLVKLSEGLGLKPNDVKKQILTTFSNIPVESYFIAQGKIQEIANKKER